MLWLIPRLRKFHDLHPEIEVHLTTQALDKSSARASHDLTVLLVGADGDLQPNVTILMRERLGFVVSPKCLDPDLALTPELVTQMPRIETSTRLEAWPLWLDLMGIGALARPWA
jgi:DNA-binding transcriptional LysR family regulator